jgi:bifunctional non-homologous end joining protein LigD
MLATLVREPFHDPGWIYEEKYDGYRILAYKEGAKVKLFSRNAIDRTERFPQIAAAIRKLQHVNLLLDGEAVVVVRCIPRRRPSFDRKRVSRFQLLQGGTDNAVFAVFDCLYLEKHDLREEPLSRRRRVLEDCIGSSKVLIASRILNANGLEAYSMRVRLGPDSTGRGWSRYIGSFAP